VGSVDAAPIDLETVRRILREHAPELEVRAFGSRVSWTARETSDLDLALMTNEPLDAARMAVLRSAFTDSRLPFRVDVVDWAGASDSFRKVIESEYVTLVERGERQGRRRWPRATLGDCIQMNDSTYSPKEAWPFVNYLDTGNVTENRVDGIHHLIPGKDKIPSRARRKVQPGDILYSTVRPNQKHFGLLKEVPENFLASTGFSVFRGRAGIAHTDFIYWFLTQDHIVERLHTIAEHSTSAYPSIRPSDIEALTLALPPLPEQRAIASVLGALDDKIDLNRRMNGTLEAMARALFKSWFVEFAPVRAKAEGRDTGLPDHIADLFPDRLVDSELGEIPEGWNRKPVSDFVSIKGGKQLPKDKFVEDGTVPVFGGAGLMGYTNDYNTEGFVVSVGRVGAYCGQFFAYRGQAWINNNASLITCKKGVSGEWIYLSLQNLDIDLIKKGAAQPFVSNSDIAAMKIISPSTYILEKFQMFSEPLFSYSDQTKSETKMLIDLRDTLLPKLVSGDLRLGEAVERPESTA